MISIIQRVTQASVNIQEKEYSRINHGYCILVGIFEEDSTQDVMKSVEKILILRIMSDSEGKMNKSIIDTGGEILLVSQFTLCADISGGRRPSFIKAKKPDEAKLLYEEMIKQFTARGISVKTGKFGHYMDVQIHNDGPVTIVVNSKDC